jgi:hypothetical protein
MDQLVVGSFRELQLNHAATITDLHLFAAQDSSSSLGQLIDGPEQAFSSGRLAPRLFLGSLDCASIFSNRCGADRDQTGAHRLMLSALGRIALWVKFTEIAGA